jgi:hypothetical protein
MEKLREKKGRKRKRKPEKEQRGKKSEWTMCRLVIYL